MRHGATALVSGCLLERNRSKGVEVVGSGTQIELVGSVVRDTNRNSSGQLGGGIGAIEGGRAVLALSLVSGNNTSGVGAWGVGSEIELFRSAIVGTASGGRLVEQTEEQVFGDGVTAMAGGVVNVISSVVRRNARAGAYYHHAAGVIEENVVWDNSSYGLAMHQCSGNVEYAGRLGDSPAGHGNYIFGNAFDLPVNEAQQVTTTPGNMPVPDPPEPMELPEVPDWEME